MIKRHTNRNGHAMWASERPAQGKPELDFTRASALRTIGEVVYAVRIGEIIKIGHTTDLASRVNQLKADEVLAFVPGDRKAEQEIHNQLNGHQHHGYEFYYPTRAVMAAVNEMRNFLGLEPVAA